MARFRFGIKYLLIVVCVCSIPISYAGVRWWRYERYKAIVDRLEHLAPGVLWERGRPVELHLDQPIENLSFKHEDFEAISQLDSLHTLSIMYAPTLSDEDFAKLAALHNLWILDLVGTPFTDAALAKLGGLKELRCLAIEGAAVSDEGLQTLHNFPNLHQINLCATDVSDKGLEQIATIKSLARACFGPVGKFGLSLEAIQRFQVARPDVDLLTSSGNLPSDRDPRPRGIDTEILLLRVDDPYCEPRVLCRAPIGTPTTSTENTLPLTVDMILKGMSPAFPPHAMKYFADHAEVVPELANGASPQLRDILAKGVPIEIIFGREDCSNHGGMDSTLRITNWGIETPAEQD